LESNATRLAGGAVPVGAVINSVRLVKLLEVVDREFEKLLILQRTGVP
jgi:hypothetical protein